MTGAIFVLRPEPGLFATMQRGREAGLAMVAMPLSHAEPVAWRVPQGEWDAILLGSANGLRHAGDALEQVAHLPVYAVGEATAREAQARGLNVARIGAGGLQTLVDSLPSERPLRLLRMSGAEHVALVPPAHVAIHPVTTYRIVHRPLAPAEVARLGEGGVVLLHSGASARHFERECTRTGIDRAALSLAALAPRIAASVSDGWKSLQIAPRPADPALLSLARDMCH